jgi:hypothetical protein
MRAAAASVRTTALAEYDWERITDATVGEYRKAMDRNRRRHLDK